MADAKPTPARDKLRDRLAGGTTVDSSDMARDKAEESAPDPDATVTTPVPPEAERSQVNKSTSGPTAAQVIAQELTTHKGLAVRRSVDITKEHRDAFVDALVNDTRFEWNFYLFGGKLAVTIQSRTNTESVAVLTELSRLVQAGVIHSGLEYASLFRAAMLRFQIKELNGVITEPYAGQLKAVAGVDPADPTKKVVTPPDWVQEARTLFEGWSDAKLAAVYQTVLDFDSAYWVMVKGAEDQNFWKPDQSMQE